MTFPIRLSVDIPDLVTAPDEVIEVLEMRDIEVVYDFDRLHENQPDKYWATDKNSGFQFGFDADQILHVIFLYATPTDGFVPIDPGSCDVPLFPSGAEVEAHASRASLRAKRGGTEFLGVRREWVRLEYPGYSLHYEFAAGGLQLVTISGR